MVSDPVLLVLARLFCSFHVSTNRICFDSVSVLNCAAIVSNRVVDLLYILQLFPSTAQGMEICCCKSGPCVLVSTFLCVGPIHPCPQDQVLFVDIAFLICVIQ